MKNSLSMTYQLSSLTDRPRLFFARLFNKLRGRGFCNVCGFPAVFNIRPASRENLRETLDCPRCGSISRDRFLVAVLSACLNQPPTLANWLVDKSILVLEPSAYRGRARLLAEKVSFRPIRYPDENLEALPDLDESIDHVVTADVFEHVRHDEQAFRQVYRVLKKGGFFFLQVPYGHYAETEIRVRPEGDKDIFLAPPQYHDEYSLVYRIYGRDLLHRLSMMGFTVGYVQGEISRLGITPQDMIVCRKRCDPPMIPDTELNFDWRL